MRGLKSLIRDEDGNDMVEFSFAATALMLLIFGIVEFSLFMNAGSFVRVAAKQGTRYWMVRGADWTTTPCNPVSSFDCEATPANVTSYVKSLPHPGLTTANILVTPTPMLVNVAGVPCAAYAQGCQVEVKVTYTFTLSTFWSASIPLTATSIETIQD